MFKIITVMLAAATAFSANGAPGGTDDIKFERTEFTSPLEVGKRHRAAKETMIYARIQPYDLYNNYLHRWIDRPLFLNRKWRESPDGTQAGFMKDVQLVKEYEIDGFTMLGNAYQNRYKDYLRIIDKGQPQGFSFMPGLAWGQIPYERYLDNARLGLKSRYAPRIDGKVPFFSYGSMPLPEIKKIREKLAADGCKDILLFDDFAIDYKGGKIQLGDLTKLNKQIQQKLDVVDGIILCNYHMHRDPLGDYTLSKKFYFALDKKYFAPWLEDIYGKKENKEKLLGFNIRHGYIGHMSGTNEAELGTEQLRQAMDTALLFNPDIISLVEWNEANENTSFQPTIYNSKSLQRIIKFYSRKIKGLPPEPNSGDNPDIPNLIVSSRQTVALGEKYRIELLNVPDSDSAKDYTVQLTLKNQNGAVIKSFIPDVFKIKNLTAVTYTIPTEQIAGSRAVIPELTITNAYGKTIRFTGLQYTRLEPAVCWNFKEVRQPLRDILIPVKSEFAVSGRNPDGSYQLTGSISAAEPLSSVEILDRESEVFAVDLVNEFNLSMNYLLAVSFSSKKQTLRQISITIPGVSDYIFKPWSYPYAGFGNWTKKADTVCGKLLFFGHGVKMLLAIPKKAKDANINFDIDGLGKFEFPVKAVIAKGKIGMELPDSTTVQIEEINKLADHPMPLENSDANYSVAVKSESGNPCFQLRAVAESGKIYRSKPLFPEAFTGKKETINVFSSTSGKAVALDVPSEEIVDINYFFDPEYGALLRDPKNPHFDAQLGGGFKYIDPMSFGKLPQAARNTSPQWVKSGDGWILRFDGIGNYLVFPAETLPHGCFTLEFECKTESKDNQALFRHYSYYSGSILTYIIDGKLQVEFASMGRNYAEKLDKLPSAPDFPVGKWIKVKITYNMQTLTVIVDGKTQTTPFKFRAAQPTAAIFGGFSSVDKDVAGKHLKFFHGDLRSIHIKHNAEP